MVNTGFLQAWAVLMPVKQARPHIAFSRSATGFLGHPADLSLVRLLAVGLHHHPKCRALRRSSVD